MSSKLQAEIKQAKPFATVEQEAILGLLRTAALVNHSMDETLRPFGLTGTQYNVLRILHGAGVNGLCGREIGERMITRVPDIPRLLDRMEKAGLISRVRDREDRRHVTARITPRGDELLDAVAKADVATQVEKRFKRVGPEKLKVLISALDAVRDE